jgi:hypothetical protein
MRHRVTVAGWKHAVLTALMAYALVLQTTLLSLGAAAHAAEAAGPQAILCASKGLTQSDHSPATAHDGLCCILGCHGAGPSGPAPEIASIERLAPVLRDAPAPADPSITHPSSDVLPVGSRAPPHLG